MEKMRKITKRKLGSKEKIVIFRWIVERISSNGKCSLGCKRPQGGLIEDQEEYPQL